MGPNFILWNSKRTNFRQIKNILSFLKFKWKSFNPRSIPQRMWIEIQSKIFKRFWETKINILENFFIHSLNKVEVSAFTCKFYQVNYEWTQREVKTLLVNTDIQHNFFLIKEIFLIFKNTNDSTSAWTLSRRIDYVKADRFDIVEWERCV